MSEPQQRPFWIRIFIPDGDPDGLRVVEKSNWTGVGIVFKRTNYKQVVARPEFNRTGVYVLVGSPEGSGLPTIYVGEGDPVKDRLSQHYSKKDFWDWAAFFVAKDNNSINKAHVQHMEWRLLDLAQMAKQCKLANGNMPSPPTLSEADIAYVNSFMLDMLSIFPLLGLGIFEKTETKDKPQDVLYIESKNIRASGYEDVKGFIVCKGSHLVKDEQPTIHNYMSTLRKDLLEQGVIEDRNGFYVFAQDQVFGSPSTAAGVILGRSANGRIEWKTEEGVTLKELQTAATKKGGVGNV